MTIPSRVPPTDESIRARVLAGKVDEASSQIVRDFGPEVMGFLRGALGDMDDADEVFAAVSERVWRHVKSFQWHCSLRTWVYIIARNETARFTRRAKRRNAGRVNDSALDDAVAAVRTETRSALRSEKRNKLTELREELPVDDRALLILRVDRGLQWQEIAQAFLPDGETCTDEQIKREAARLRKRFQLVTRRLGERAREEGLIP